MPRYLVHLLYEWIHRSGPSRCVSIVIRRCRLGRLRWRSPLARRGLSIQYAKTKLTGWCASFARYYSAYPWARHWYCRRGSSIWTPIIWTLLKGYFYISHPSLKNDQDCRNWLFFPQKRFFASLDNLIYPSAYSTSSPKRRSIYRDPHPNSPPLVYPSTSPLPLLPSPAIYAPFSPLALLSRLRTFTPSTYSPFHPTELTPLIVARTGWINVGREKLTCGYCGVSWDLKGLEDIKDIKIKAEVARRLGRGVEDRHAKGCAWRIRSTPGQFHQYSDLFRFGTTLAMCMSRHGKFCWYITAFSPQRTCSCVSVTCCIRCCRVVCHFWLGNYKMNVLRERWPLIGLPLW